MDTDLASDTLLKLLKEEVFEILLVGQVGQGNKETDNADQHNDNQGANDTSSDHSCSLD